MRCRKMKKNTRLWQAALKKGNQAITEIARRTQRDREIGKRYAI